jgi:3-demethoxyubiquinol 3-hydroxylase
MTMRRTHFIDQMIGELDNALRTIIPPKKRSVARHSPAEGMADNALDQQQKKHSAALMRVNHAGEVCAQALYQGQALTAQLTHIKQQMTEAALEETDHLGWCEQRLYELDSKPSILNLAWYSGSFVLGALAGLAGDKISLGFVAETERQVGAHLQHHLHIIPKEDKKTEAILKKMQEDEEHHAYSALAAGAVELPDVIKQVMRMVSMLMTKSSYYV